MNAHRMSEKVLVIDLVNSDRSREWSSNLLNGLDESDIDVASTKDLGEFAQLQIETHGLLSYLVLAREQPAVVLLDEVILSELVEEAKQQDEHIERWLGRDSYLFVVADDKGFEAAKMLGLEAAPLQHQSQASVLRSLRLYCQTNVMLGFSSASAAVRRKIVRGAQRHDVSRTLAGTPRPKAQDANLQPVLILGQSGSGKEVVANALWNAAKLSGRCEKLACGALDRNLMFEELKGHWEGAYTGSHGERAGVLETCHKGSVLFDDLDAAPEPLWIQGALLRFLDGKSRPPTIRRLGKEPAGEDADRPADTWVLVATNRNPRELIQQQPPLMREDFLRRFQYIIAVPPLAQRKNDIPAIAQAILAELEVARELDIPALRWLRDRNSDWQGNARELHALLLCSRDILLEDPTLSWVEAFRRVSSVGTDYLDWYGLSDVYGPVQDAGESATGNISAHVAYTLLASICANEGCSDQHHAHSQRVFAEQTQRWLARDPKNGERLQDLLDATDDGEAVAKLLRLREQSFAEVQPRTYQALLLLNDYLWLTQYFAWLILQSIDVDKRLPLVESAWKGDAPPNITHWHSASRLEESATGSEQGTANFANQKVFRSACKPASTSLHCDIVRTAVRIVALWCSKAGRGEPPQFLRHVWPEATSST